MHKHVTVKFINCAECLQFDCRNGRRRSIVLLQRPSINHLTPGISHAISPTYNPSFIDLASRTLSHTPLLLKFQSGCEILLQHHCCCPFLSSFFLSGGQQPSSVYNLIPRWMFFVLCCFPLVPFWIGGEVPS